MALGALAITTSSASEKEHANWEQAAMRESRLYGVDPKYVKARTEGRDVHASDTRRTWKDWLLIAIAISLFVGLGALARVPQMNMQVGWLGLFAAAMLFVLAAGAVVLWRVTKFN